MRETTSGYVQPAFVFRRVVHRNEFELVEFQSYQKHLISGIILHDGLPLCHLLGTLFLGPAGMYKVDNIDHFANIHARKEHKDGKVN